MGLESAAGREREGGCNLAPHDHASAGRDRSVGLRLPRNDHQQKNTPGARPGVSLSAEPTVTFQRGTAATIDCDLGGCSNQSAAARFEYVGEPPASQRKALHDSYEQADGDATSQVVGRCAVELAYGAEPSAFSAT
jgi:hypothetical protein